MTQVFAVKVFPFKRMACASTNRGSPISTMAPSVQNLSSESCFCMTPMTDWILLATSRKYTGLTSTGGRPNFSAFFIKW